MAMTKGNESANVACRKYEPLLEDYLSGELAGTRAKEVAEHLGACARCREAFELATASTHLLRALAPATGPGQDFSRLVMVRVRAAEEERIAERAGFWQSFVSLGWRFAATATLALGILVTYDAGWGRRAQPSASALRLINVSDFLAPSDPARPPANRDEALMMVAESNYANH